MRWVSSDLFIVPWNFFGIHVVAIFADYNKSGLSTNIVARILPVMKMKGLCCDVHVTFEFAWS